MPNSSPIHRRAARQESVIEAAPYVAGLTAAVATAILAFLVPPMLVLPALSVALVSIGFTLAAIVWRGPPAITLASRYLSAALTFLGFGAALLTDVEQALPFFESARKLP